MERGNSKHSPQLDEQLAKEAEAYTRGAPVSSRVDEWRDPELAGDDQPEPVWSSGGSGQRGALAPLTAEEIAARSRLGRSIPRTALPADREKLLAGADELRVPPDVRAELERLPTNRTYHTVYEIWEALGYRNEPESSPSAS